MASPSSPQDQGQTRDDVFKSARFASASSSGAFEAQTAASVFSQANAYDPEALHPLSGLGGKEVDYLLLEDERLSDLQGAKSVIPARGWTDELCYGTGTTYLSGLAFGGLWGLREGLLRPLTSRAHQAAFQAVTSSSSTSQSHSSSTSQPVHNPSSAPSGQAPPSGNPGSATGAQGQHRTMMGAAESMGRGAGIPGTAAAAENAAAEAAGASAGGAGTGAASRRGPTARVPFKLRLNTVLNSMTRRGSFMGNTAGVLALMYNAVNASLDRFRGKHDILGSMASGAGTGLIFRSTAGLRPMLMTSAQLAVLAGLWTKFKYLLF